MLLNRLLCLYSTSAAGFETGTKTLITDKLKKPTINYFHTFIEVAEYAKEVYGKKPISRKDKKMKKTKALRSSTK